MDRILFTSFFRANYFSFRSLLFSALALCIGASTAFTIKAEVQNDPTVWYEDFYEPNFPFFTSTVDARSFEPPQLISNSALSLSDALGDRLGISRIYYQGLRLFNHAKHGSNFVQKSK